MRIGMMRNQIQIVYLTQQKNGVGEREISLNPYLTIMAAVTFEKTHESGSKFTDGWSDQLIVTTRYSQKLMSVINARSSYKIIFQGNTYTIKNYEIWNQVQDYVKFYIQQDKS